MKMWKINQGRLIKRSIYIDKKWKGYVPEPSHRPPQDNISTKYGKKNEIHNRKPKLFVIIMTHVVTS